MKKLREGFFLIGVAHILPKSLHEVRELIEKERPEVVAVELDPFRYAMMVQGGVGVAQQATSRPKPSAVILTGLMGLLQTKFSRQTGMPAGEEMMVAIGKAKEVGAEIKLIDQDIRVTLDRMNELMPLRERVWLMFQMLLSILPSWKKVKLEELTEEQVVNYLIQGFRKLSPTTYRVLIEERDDYMTSKLVPLLESGKRAVCVVGAGHVPGIDRRLEEALREMKAKIWWGTKIEYEWGG